MLLGNIVDTANYKWLEGVETNIRGTFNIAKAFLADCTEDAVLIDVNSAAAHILLAPGFSAYNVSKIATSRIYSSLVLEHPQLSFFSIQPGTINSNINRTSGYKPQQEGEEFQWGESAKALSQYDDVGLPASFMVWLASGEARFLNGKFLWANWDVDELKEREKELKGSTLLTMGLLGYATT